MKRLPSVLLLIFFFVFIMMAPQVGAEQKTDGKPDGGTLNYGEYGRPTTLDPITSNDMISMRITELIFNGLVGINEKQEIVREKELTDVQKKIRDAASIGEISNVQDELGFAVINAGKNKGIEPRMQFAIRRNVFIVGKVTVDSVADGGDSSIVNIVQGSVQPGLKIKAGDTVIAYPIY